MKLLIHQQLLEILVYNISILVILVYNNKLFQLANALAYSIKP
jgi:hypothetical protein